MQQVVRNGKQRKGYIFFFFRKHRHFLSIVWVYTLSAFGGPQGHLGLLQRMFVERQKLITATELLDLNVFTQILPGPASTQILGLIAYKKGGPFLSFIVLSIWILPAMLLMLLFALFYTELKGRESDLMVSFSFVGAMALAFFASYCWKMLHLMERRKTTFLVSGVAAIFTYFFFHSPWVFPIVIVLGGGVSYYVNRHQYPVVQSGKVRMYWGHLAVFLGLFFIGGLLSEWARVGKWEHRKYYNVFENNYRFGIFVFGGGQVLIPMMYEKYALSLKTRYIDKEDLLAGAGILQVIPGPVFAISTYVGAMVFSKEGRWGQIIGAIIATVAIFLPGYLLSIFFYPLWKRVKHNSVIFRAMMGLNAAVVGLLLGSFMALLVDNDFLVMQDKRLSVVAICVFVGTLLLLRYKCMSPPFIVLSVLALGWLMNGL